MMRLAFILPSVLAVGPCSYTTKDGKLTYSLDAVSLKTAADGAFYEIKDSVMQSSSGGKYAYAFNVCGNVMVKETKCALKPAAAPASATAFQVSVNEGWCNQAGDVSTAFAKKGLKDSGVKMGLLTAYDSVDDLNRVGTGMTDSTRMSPASGFYYKMFGGDDCGGKQRSLMLKFICDEGKINYMPDKITQAQVAANNWIKQEHTHRVVENGECTYETEIYSSLGCPTQCPVSDGRVCGAHGVCGWDTELKVARCMCNSGWGGLTGTECASTFAGPTTPFNLEYVGIALVSIVLCGIVGTLAYVGTCLFRIKKKQDNLMDDGGMGSDPYANVSGEMDGGDNTY